MMKLHYSPASEYVRKVTVVAKELGLDGRIELIGDKRDLEKHNPLLKRPTLLTDDGTAIIDSPVICEYLDALAGGGLIPAAGAARWRALTQQALADGVMEAITLIRVDRSFHDQPSPDWHERQMTKIVQGFDAFEAQAGAGALSGPLTIGQITVGVLCEYVDFAFNEFHWRDGRSALATWHASFAERPSMQATRLRQPEGRMSALPPRAKRD